MEVKHHRLKRPLVWVLLLLILIGIILLIIIWLSPSTPPPNTPSGGTSGVHNNPSPSGPDLPGLPTDSSGQNSDQTGSSHSGSSHSGGAGNNGGQSSGSNGGGGTTIPTLPGRTWPSASDTGADGNGLTVINGDVVLDNSYNGQTYENKHINGILIVTGCNITIHNVEIYGGSTGSDYYALWFQNPDTCSNTVDHVSVLAGAAPNNFVSTGIRDGFGGPLTITHTKIIGTQDGINGMGAGLVEDNYIELGATLNGEHNDGFQTGGSDGLTIRHNTILNPNGETSALALFTEFGPNKNMVVQDNLLAGGGYACYCGDGTSDNNGNPARSVNVDFIDNVFWRRYYPAVGFFGAGTAYNSAGGGEWTNNVYMNYTSGATTTSQLTTELVPQPSIDQ